MGAIAERLVHRPPIAALRNGSALGTKLVALGVEQQNRALHQVRSVVESGDLCLFSHDFSSSSSALALADKRAASVPTRTRWPTRTRSNLKVVGAVRSITYLLNSCRCLQSSLYRYFTIRQVYT